MSTADTYVRARIDTDTKKRAAEALAAMGLTISDAIRLLMLRIADERRAGKAPHQRVVAPSGNIACSSASRCGAKR